MVKAHESPHTKISILRFRFSCAIRSGLMSSKFNLVIGENVRKRSKSICDEHLFW